MHDTGLENTEFHLPERWAVLEEALRQMNSEGTPASGSGDRDELDSLAMKGSSGTGSDERSYMR